MSFVRRRCAEGRVLGQAAVTAGVLVVAIALAGCGSSQPAGHTAALSDEAFDVVMNQASTSQDSATIDAAVGELDRRCMMAKGWQARPRTGESLSSVTARRADTLESRRRYGYGLHEAALKRNAGAPPGDAAGTAYDRWLAGLPPKTVARMDVDEGGPAGTERDFTIDGAGTTSAPTVGCSADANRAIFGSIEASLRVGQIGEVVLPDLHARTEADPRYAEVFVRWSACMTKAGHPARTPEEAKDELSAAIASQGPTKELFAREVATAVADLTCANEVGVQSTLQTITRDVARSLDAERVRLVMVAIEERSAALARAKQVLSDGDGIPASPRSSGS